MCLKISLNYPVFEFILNFDFILHIKFFMTLYDSDLNTCIVAFDDFFGVDDVFNGAIGEAVRRIVSGELVGDKWGL